MSSSDAWANFQVQRSGVLITFQETTPTDEEFDRFLQQFRDILTGADAPLFLMVDTRGAAAPCMRHVRRKVAFLREHDELIKARVESCATIVTSALVRWGINALFALRTPVRPHEVFDDISLAVEWLKQRQTQLLEAAGAADDTSS